MRVVLGLHSQSTILGYPQNIISNILSVLLEIPYHPSYTSGGVTFVYGYELDMLILSCQAIFPDSSRNRHLKMCRESTRPS